MLKIEEVHLYPDASGEYVVLQNHGLNTLSLRGWMLCGDSFLEADAQERRRDMYVFADDIPVKPYARIVLFTGEGENEWRPTIDGKFAYLVYWGRHRPVWSEAERIYLLQPVSMRRVRQPAMERAVASRM